MNKLKELREVIIKANPEIVELKRGCEIVFPKASMTSSVAIVFEGDVLVFDTGIGHPQLVKLDIGMNYEVIGRPITLADVLMAEEKFGVKLEKSYTVEQRVTFQSNNLYKLLELWNLKENSLDNQSPETIDFLYKLLVGKDE